MLLHITKKKLKIVDQLSSYYQNKMLSHSNAYQWLIINKICFVICHKLTIMKSFVSKKTFIIAKKKVHENSIFNNLQDVLVGTYSVNITCYNFIYK